MKIDPSKRNWKRPAYLGFPSAIDQMSTVAAPLLAGFSISFIGVITQAPKYYLAPGLALTFLTMAVISLVSCVQLGFYARQYIYSREEIEGWMPPDPTPEGTVADASQIPSKTSIMINQGLDFEKWLTLAKRASVFFNIGIIAIGLSIGTSLLPPESYEGDPLSTHELRFRWVAASLAFLAALGETLWWIIGKYRTK